MTTVTKALISRKRSCAVKPSNDRDVVQRTKRLFNALPARFKMEGYLLLGRFILETSIRLSPRRISQ